MRIYLIAFWCVVLLLLNHRQVKANDDKSQQNDSAKIASLNLLASKYITIEPDSGIYFGELALKISLKSKQYEFLSETHRILGWCYYQQQNFNKAQFHLQFAATDSSMSINERDKVYIALINSSEAIHDYQHSYLFLKYEAQLKDSINQQKQTVVINQLQNQFNEKQQLTADQLHQKDILLKLAKKREEQLKLILITITSILLLALALLFFLFYVRNKNLKNILEEQVIAIAETNSQYKKLQNEITEYEKLKVELEKNKRENRIEEISVESKQELKPEIKEEQFSLIDQYSNADENERRTLFPMLESFQQNIPPQLLNIEQAFARHDWNMINNTLQSIKPIIHHIGLFQCENLINEINEHVNANATNRAVVKLLQVKSLCLKTITAIENVLK